MERQKAEYKSAARSREKLLSAYFALLQEREPNQITVAALVRKAGVNRSTFYAHYEDMQALTRAVHRRLTDQLLQILAPLQDPQILAAPLPILEQITAFVTENETLLRALAHTRTAADQIAGLEQLFVQYMQAQPYTDGTLPYALRAQFYAGGVGRTYLAYLLGDLQCPPEQLAPALDQLIRASSLLFDA